MHPKYNKNQTKNALTDSALQQPTTFLAVRTGLEPATSCVTGRHSNQTELPDQIAIVHGRGKSSYSQRIDQQQDERA